MQRKNDYTKEIQGLKVTARWLKWWFVVWVWHEVTGTDPGIPLYFLAAIITVCLPIGDFLYAPVDRWLDQRIRAYKVRRDMREDKNALV